MWFSVFTAWQTAKVSTPSHHFTVHHLTSLQEVHNICLLEMGYETITQGNDSLFIEFT